MKFIKKTQGYDIKVKKKFAFFPKKLDFTYNYSIWVWLEFYHEAKKYDLSIKKWRVFGTFPLEVKYSIVRIKGLLPSFSILNVKEVCEEYEKR